MIAVPPIIENGAGRARVPSPRSGWIAALIMLALAGTMVLFLYDPARYPVYPVCTFHRVTGWQCPGCGSLRAVHNLLHGHLATAFQFNPLLVLSLPALGWFAGRQVYQGITGRRLRPLEVRPAWIWILFTVVIVFTLVRNLPASPLALPSATSSEPGNLSLRAWDQSHRNNARTHVERSAYV